MGESTRSQHYTLLWSVVVLAYMFSAIFLYVAVSVIERA